MNHTGQLTTCLQAYTATKLYKTSRADSRVGCIRTSDISETEWVSETSEVFIQVTRLSARQDFILREKDSTRQDTNTLIPRHVSWLACMIYIYMSHVWQMVHTRLHTGP
jgi:hypothetical protein